MSDLNAHLHAENAAEPSGSLQREVESVLRLRSSLAQHYLSHLRPGQRGTDVVNALRRYLTGLKRPLRSTLSRHSRYYWIYHQRRHLIVDQGVRAEILQRLGDDLSLLIQETQVVNWLYKRLTLAALKYGSRTPDDMSRKAPPHEGTTGYTQPGAHGPDDSAALTKCWLLMMEFEEARYALKRAGKGGSFSWTRRRDFRFDVQLPPSIRTLAEIYDARADRNRNLLEFYGSWAPTRVGFATPHAEHPSTYVPLHPDPDAPVPMINLGKGRPVVLALMPNTGQRGQSLDWTRWLEHQIPGQAPTFLLQWFDLEAILPRLELVRGVLLIKSSLSGRNGYDSKDLVSALGALTQWEREYCEHVPQIWAQLLMYGYTVWTNVEATIDDRLLPHYLEIRRTLGGAPAPSEGRRRLRAVLRDIGWSERDIRHIDLLEARPSKALLQLGDDEWLVDWSLMLGTLLELVDPLGRLEGAIARYRGRDFERTLANFIASESERRGFTVFRIGLDAGVLRFASGATRDNDLGIVAGKCLVVVEAKAFSGARRLRLVGDPGALMSRWQDQLIPAMRQADSLARRIAKEPVGRNYVVPQDVREVLPIVCLPMTEWIPSRARKWWPCEEIPCFCTPEELVELLVGLKEGECKPHLSYKVH
jgi:hypothetical protein